MIGPLEIVILAVILLVVFGGVFYKRLPALGRSAGKGARVGGEKAKEIAGVVSEKAESIDAQSVGRSAGKGIREAKELKEAITAPTTSPKAATSGEAKPATGGDGSSSKGESAEESP